MIRRSVYSAVTAIAMLSVSLLAGCGAGNTATSGAASGSTAANATSSGEGTATSEDGAFPVTVDTKFGSVTVDSQPKRVVAVGWGDAEIALNLGVEPVGASDWLSFGGEGVGPWSEGEYTTPPEILGTMELSYEAVGALKPDLILDVRSSGDQERYEKLSSIAPTIGVPEGGDNYVIEDPHQQVRMIAAALGKQQAGEDMIEHAEEAFTQAVETHPDWKDKTVTVASRTTEGWGAYTEDSRVDFMTRLGFVQNPKIAALPATDTRFSVPISEEQLDLYDSDLLIAFPIFADPSLITEDASWNSLATVKDGRALVLPKEISSAFSLSTPLAQEYALKQLVPLIEEAIGK